jgi:hypothetical protein
VGWPVAVGAGLVGRIGWAPGDGGCGGHGGADGWVGGAVVWAAHPVVCLGVWSRGDYPDVLGGGQDRSRAVGCCDESAGADVFLCVAAVESAVCGARCVWGDGGQTRGPVARGTTVRTLEHVTQNTEQSVASFRTTAPPPEPATGETVVVAVVDGKGGPLCRDTPPEAAGRQRRKCINDIFLQKTS